MTTIETPQATNGSSIPIVVASSAAPTPGPSMNPPPTRTPALVREPNSAVSQPPNATHATVADGATNTQQAIQFTSSNLDSPAGCNFPADQTRREAQNTHIGGEPNSGRPASLVAYPMGVSLADPTLALAADVLDDLERVRIANESRLRQLTRSVEDSDGEMRGFGLTEADPAVARLAAIVDLLAKAEADATKNLERSMRTHSLGSWVKHAKGVGDKQGARLLAAIGDPYWNDLHDRPRTVSELWAYCGYRPGQRRQRGEKANWSATAKMRAFNIADSCKQQLAKPCYSVKDGKGRYVSAVHLEECSCSPYRVLYDEGRAKYGGTVHPETCVRCGPSGKPAPAGSLRGDAHVDQMALRLVSKAILRDLWREAKRLHEMDTPPS